jgi:hypothetical protein
MEARGQQNNHYMYLLSEVLEHIGYSGSQLAAFLPQIPRDNFGPIVSKAIELWDSHSNPLSPSGSVSTGKVDSSPLHELYEIEDYS